MWTRCAAHSDHLNQTNELQIFIANSLNSDHEPNRLLNQTYETNELQIFLANSLILNKIEELKFSKIDPTA